jgi:hypothetical protein
MRRALVAACAAIALPAASAIAACGSASGQHSSGPAAAPSVITKQQAQQALSQYTATNNRSNQARDASLLATYEGGSSYQIDRGQYRWTKVTDPANHAYTQISYLNPVFYIPQQLHYPAWFAARVYSQDAKKPQSGPAAQYQYLVFTRSSASAKWMAVLEPGVVSGSGSPPQVATDANGYAQTVTAADAQRLAAAPAKLPAMDVSYLNYGTYQQMTKQLQQARGLKPKAQAKPVTFANGQANLVDLHDESFWSKSMPQGSSQSVLHATTSDPVYALRTTDGGALVFYDLTADLTLGAPYGGMMGMITIRVPGFLNGKEKPQASFSIHYGEQFAVYEPPGRPASPRVVADNSGPVSAECGGGPCGQ